MTPTRRSLALPVLAAVLTLFAARLTVAQDADALLEELRVATARLEYATEKLQHIAYPLGADDRRERQDILRRSRYLMKQAATVPRTNTDGVQDLITLLGETRDEADAFLDHVAPVWQQPNEHSYRGSYRSPYMEVLKFHGIAEQTLTVLDRLSAGGARRVHELVQAGEDRVAGIKETRESDHATRDEHVRALIKIREELMGLQQAAIEERPRGYAFVRQSWNRHAWTDVGHVENGFRALRARFLEPGSAYLTVTNDGMEPRPLFIELEFYAPGGDRTGTGLYETASLEEIRPGEIREVLVPIQREDAQFWARTSGFTVYLD